MHDKKRRYFESNSDYIKNEIENYMNDAPCPKCKGARLNPESLAVTVGNKNIYQLCLMSIKDELDYIESLVLSERDAVISNQILKEIKSRLNFLMDVGLDYLNLWRNAGTLSGGEAQRIRLATQIGASLVGVLYILDIFERGILV
jgi:excinuclease ABC subunit A